MFRRRPAPRQRLKWAISRFREKGATSPDKAMTLEELDLPNRFEEVVDRPRLSRLGIFIETKGRYYLSEERLRALRDQSAIGSTSQTRGAEMVPCEYCDTLMPASSVRCPVCGAPRKSHSDR